jgi:hypothetical protein
MTPATIATLFNPGDAHLVRSRLEAAGFHPQVLHELSSLSMEGYALSAGGIQVQVPGEEADEARAFLQHSKPVEGSVDEPPQSN